jgi:hypothetical protein
MKQTATRTGHGHPTTRFGLDPDGSQQRPRYHIHGTLRGPRALKAAYTGSRRKRHGDDGRGRGARVDAVSFSIYIYLYDTAGVVARADAVGNITKPRWPETLDGDLLI